MTTNSQSYETYKFAGKALDPIHVGNGGIRLGRVDNTIVRDPVTRIPKIPGSSIAGVMRAYTAMAEGKYPKCAGIGQAEHDGTDGHNGVSGCPVCTVFGFAKGMGSAGGFAGLAAFSDIHVLLFPVSSQLGPQWITCPMALRQIADVGSEFDRFPNENAIYRKDKVDTLNLGWLLLPVETRADWDTVIKYFEDLAIPEYIMNRLGVVSDKLFSHIVNSNLEVRTSVAIDPATGAAADGALFTHEAIPRFTVLFWEVTCRNPGHFKINKKKVEAVDSPEAVKNILVKAHPYLEHLGIGGMGSRGMGRLRVLENKVSSTEANSSGKGVS